MSEFKKKTYTKVGIEDVRESAPPDANGYRILHTGKAKAKYYKTTGFKVYVWYFSRWKEIRNNDIHVIIKPLWS